MKKILLTLILAISIVMPTLAGANWVDLGNGSFLNKNVEKYYYNRNNYGNYYSVWLKYLNDCSAMFNDFNTGICKKEIDYLVVQHIHDCDNNKFSIQGFLRYDNKANVIDSLELNDYQMEWHSIPPDSVISAEHNLACLYSRRQ